VNKTVGQWSAGAWLTMIIESSTSRKCPTAVKPLNMVADSQEKRTGNKALKAPLRNQLPGYHRPTVADDNLVPTKLLRQFTFVIVQSAKIAKKGRSAFSIWHVLLILLLLL
jgi:hypothetical protein